MNCAVYWVTITSFLLLFPKRYINLFFIHLLLLFLHLVFTFCLITIWLLHPLGFYSPQHLGSIWQYWPHFLWGTFLSYPKIVLTNCSFFLFVIEQVLHFHWLIQSETHIKCLLCVSILQIITHCLFPKNLLFWWEGRHIMNANIRSFHGGEISEDTMRKAFWVSCEHPEG